MAEWSTTEGSISPLGVTWIEQELSYNFSLYSKYAESITLLLYTEEDVVNPVFTYQFDYLKNKTGRIWHCRIPKAQVKNACYYAYSIAGPQPESRFEWHAFDPQKILFDPFTKSVFFPPIFSRSAAMRPGSNAGQAPLGVICADEQKFNWEADHHPRHESDLVIYELHVRGFTKSPHSGVSRDKQGTYLGLVEKIPYLKDLGITAVELMPVFQYDHQEGNFWGYMPLSFFAPHSGYAGTRQICCGPHREFRTMVKALHEAGIEVILDVVYNHTAEGDHNGPLYNFKGIDNSTYYLISDQPERPYQNFSGTGNTLNCANRYVRKMVLDSLRYWVNEMHVDGFRFDLSSIFTRNADGTINMGDPLLLGDITSAPDLLNIRLLAEPWDAGGAYHLGKEFPGRLWFQWNGRFRDDIRRFVRGDPGMVSPLMYRLYGSDDLFPDERMHAFHPYQSINYITSHDGFTLYDLVSYARKRNQANGCHNLDGPEENYSWNCGTEGDDNLPLAVLRLRKQQIKNFCCMLFLSNGTPMLRSGDEFMQTQKGNNNPFNQDNEISRLNWERFRTNQDIFRFFKLMIAFRKAHPSLCRSRFWRNDIRWYGTGPMVDMSYHSHSLAFCLQGASCQDADIYVMINAWQEDLPFTIQEGQPNRWKRVIDTSLESPKDFCLPGEEISLKSEIYQVKARSLVLLIRH